jgi:hypothetical protein
MVISQTARAAAQYIVPALTVLTLRQCNLTQRRKGGVKGGKFVVEGEMMKAL